MLKLLFLESSQFNFSCNSYVVVQNMYNNIVCEIVDFVLRKGNDTTAEVINFSNFLTVISKKMWS
jgi:hypothetical protein